MRLSDVHMFLFSSIDENSLIREFQYEEALTVLTICFKMSIPQVAYLYKTNIHSFSCMRNFLCYLI